MLIWSFRQSDGQKATPCWTILALRVRMAQFLNLLLHQHKLTFGHVYIIQSLISLSMRKGVVNFWALEQEW
jgi:hypothetical protein